jgi:hypothetical protein
MPVPSDPGPKLATTRSGRPSPFMSAIFTDWGPAPAGKLTGFMKVRGWAGW